MSVRIAAITLLAGLLAIASPAGAGAPARASYVQGEVVVQAPGETQWAFVDPNLFLFQGDLVWTGPGSLLELELPGQVILRAGPNARFELGALEPEPEIHHITGPLYLCAARTTRMTAARLHTRSISIELQKGSAVRSDALETGGCRITAREGFIWYRALDEGGYLFEDQAIYVEPGLLPSEPAWADATDDFDLWAAEACRGVTVKGLGVVGASTLTGAGRWGTAAGRQVWVPFVHEQWSPYQYGQWLWVPGHGWVWHPNEPWGWITHHYGSWTWTEDMGWGWVPGTAWHGGNVQWWQTGGYLVWAPLNPLGYPVTLAGGLQFNLGGLQVGIAAVHWGSRSFLVDGVIRPEPRQEPEPGPESRTDHIGPVWSPPFKQALRTDPPEGGQRGGRHEDDVAGEARERARAIARRAIHLRDGGGSGDWNEYGVGLPEPVRTEVAARVLPKKGWTAAGSGDSTAPSGTTGSSWTNVTAGGFTEAPVLLPEAGGLSPTAEASARKDFSTVTGSVYPSRLDRSTGRIRPTEMERLARPGTESAEGAATMSAAEAAAARRTSVPARSRLVGAQEGFSQKGTGEGVTVLPSGSKETQAASTRSVRTSTTKRSGFGVKVVPKAPEAEKTETSSSNDSQSRDR